jgi:hypothetical protein
LEWEGDADLNLFVRAPSGRTVSWANPSILDGGTLQIDSNTGCETPTAQPVEHIFWPEDKITPGDYTVWVWFQNVCISPDPITFILTLAFNGETIFVATNTPQNPLSIEPGERYEIGVRVAESGNATPLGRGSKTTPSPQQTASQGGDPLIVYGQNLTGTITNQVFAQFYQFQGNAGDKVTIRVERIAGNLDPIVVLRDSLDNNLVLVDDVEGNHDPELTYTLTQSGRHVISVTRFGLRDGTTTGDYRLTLLHPTN